MDSTQNVCRQLSRRLSTQLIGPELRSAMSALNVSKCGMSSSGKAGWDRRDSDIEGLDDDLEEMKHEAIARCALLLASRRRNGSVRRLSPLPVVMSSLPLDEDLRGVVNTGADTSRRRGKRVKKKARPVDPMLAAIISMPALHKEQFLLPTEARRRSLDRLREAAEAVVSSSPRMGAAVNKKSKPTKSLTITKVVQEAVNTKKQRQMMNVTSIPEGSLTAMKLDELQAMQRSALLSHGRAYPLGLRTDSSNMDPFCGWRAGLQMVALNLQTNDVPTQLHYALFELDGGSGYVLKPKELCTPSPDGPWPPTRQNLSRVTLRVISLHHLPVQREQRPWTTSGKHAGCHDFTSLSGKTAPPKANATVSTPSIQLELHAIGGFCCVSDLVHPSHADLSKTFRTKAVDTGGLLAEFDQVVHCLASEPRETVLRVVVMDGDAEVAYETAVFGALRTGHRCFQLRHMRTGTRIQLCALLVHIAVGEEPNLWAKDDMLRQLLEKQQASHEALQSQVQEQRKRIEELEAALDEGRCVPSPPNVSPTKPPSATASDGGLPPPPPSAPPPPSSMIPKHVLPPSSPRRVSWCGRSEGADPPGTATMVRVESMLAI
mmetsp:Transcript_71502/g.195992  ORF Transcript_71502/g.195992 Transcript_71502/m.195992 type:complete len:603 (+) Transcript_71502:1-1809(+)